MGRAGTTRARLAETLKAAYGAGLISDNTLSHRLDLLYTRGLVEPRSLVGDISRRRPSPGVAADAARTLRAALRSLLAAAEGPPLLLALDWGGGCEELLIGRHPSCDVLLAGQSVSRRHAALRFRDGRWIVQDLESRNGTRVNGERVQRCELRPGDVLTVGGNRLRID
jgi:hypothetical protein